MKKTAVKTGALVSFLQKYHLGGTIESATVSVDSGVATVKFINDNKTVFGVVSDFALDLPDGTYSIYSTSKLMAMVGALGTEIDIEPLLIDTTGKMLTLTSKANDISATFILADPTIIPAYPKKINLPAHETEIALTPEFVTAYNKGYQALGSPALFAIIDEKGKVTLALNYSTTTSTDMVKLKTANESNIDHPVYFSSEVLKNILAANKDATKSKLEIANAGIMTVKFEYAEYKVTYHVVADKLGKQDE